ncbi:phage tail protein [Salinicoccus roseus]|uniref:phage tail protein n=1 Tax=Salinicoccus roseus TaxID=45670 RepID=UPI0023014CE5|nr:hypothetical protein [Salinicoccus roseus]
MAGEANYSIEADVKANIGKFRSAIKAAKQTLRSFESTSKSVKDTEVGADISPLRRHIAAAKAAMQSFTSKEYDAEIDGEISGFRRSLLIAKALAQSFSSEPITKRIKMDMIGVRDAYRSIKTQFTDPFNRRMGELAENIHAFSTVIGNQIKGGMISSFSAVIPVVAGATSAIMALGNAIGVVAGGAIGMAGAFAIAGAGAVAYGGLVSSVLSRYNSETFQATESSNRFTRAVDEIKSSWNSIVSSNMDAIFNTMATAVGIANNALTRMTPFIDGVVTSVGNLSGRIESFVNDSIIMEDFFTNMNTTGVQVFNDLINAAFEFGSGFIDTMNALFPLFKWTSQGIQDMAMQFNSWAQDMAGTNGFNQFIEYTKTNLPKIGQIFGNTFLGIIDLFAAFGSNSSNVFDALVRMSAQFRNWSSTIAESRGFQNFIDYVETNGPTIISLIGNVIMMVVNFGVALAPLGQAVLNVVNNVTQFVQELLKTDPIVGQIIGVIVTLAGVLMAVIPVAIQIGTIVQGLIAKFVAFRGEATTLRAVWMLLSSAFSWILSPITLIMAAIAGLVASFIHLWNTNEQFRTRVMAIWTQIQTHISTAIQAVSSFVKSIWGTLVTWWNENNELIMAVALKVWNGILSAIQVAMAILVPVVRVAWNLIKGIIEVALNLILGIVKAVMQMINGDWSGAWETVKATAVKVWNAIRNAIGNAIQVILPIISNFVQNAYNWIRDKFSQAAQIAEIMWHRMLGIIRMKINVMKQHIQHKLQQIKQTIQDKFQQAKDAVMDKMQQMASTALNKALEVYNNIRSEISKVPSMVGDYISDAAQAVRNKASEFLSAGIDIIAGLISGIKQKAGDAIAAAKGVVGDALSGAKRLLGIKSPSRAFMAVGRYSSQGIAVGIAKDAYKAVRSVKNVAGRMTRAFTPSLIAPQPTGLSNTFRSIKKQASMHIGEAFNSTVKLNKQPAVIYLNMGNRTFKAHVSDITNRQIDESNLEEVYGGA